MLPKSSGMFHSCILNISWRCLLDTVSTCEATCYVHSIRNALQNTELKFDLVSPVNELAKQIRMEFDFLHEAETMDAVGEHLMVSHRRLQHLFHDQHLLPHIQWRPLSIRA